MIDKLIEGNIKNDVECLDAVEKLLMTLYEAWKDIVENPRADGVPSAKLQPEDYRKYLDEQNQVQNTADKGGPAKGDAGAKPAVKLMA